jgi:hypothetical protein
MNDRRDLRGQVSEMGKETTPYRVYDPNLLKAMGMAFDAALNALPHEGRGEIRMRRELALLIIYFADRGEADPARLSRLALVRMNGREDFDLIRLLRSSGSGSSLSRPSRSTRQPDYRKG